MKADIYDDDQVKAFLDDLTRVCIKHGFYIDTSQADDRYDLPGLEEIGTRNFHGYVAASSSGVHFLKSVPSHMETLDVAASENLSEMSAHQKMRFLAGRDTAQEGGAA